MDDPTTKAAFQSGGQSGGAAYPNEVQDDGDGKFEGGQSIRDYHGPQKGGDANEATGSPRQHPNSDEDKE